MATVMATPKANPKKQVTSKPARSRQKRAGTDLVYIRDASGDPVAVVVPVALFEELVEAAEQLEDLAQLAKNEAVPGEPVPWEQVKRELRAAGKAR